MRSLRFSFLLLLAGCQDDEVEFAAPNRETPLGFRYNYHEDLGGEIDYAAQLYLDYDPAASLDTLRAYPIVVSDTATVNGRYLGYTHYGSHIEVVRRSRWTDPFMSMDHTDLLILRHEWKHVMLGDWHPE